MRGEEAERRTDWRGRRENWSGCKMKTQKVGLPISNDLIEKNLSQVYPAAWVLVDSRCGQVDNQEEPSQLPAKLGRRLLCALRCFTVYLLFVSQGLSSAGSCTSKPG